MREIVGGVVRYRDLVAKIKIAKFFPGEFVGDSRKFVLAKISRYTVLFGMPSLHLFTFLMFFIFLFLYFFGVNLSYS